MINSTLCLIHLSPVVCFGYIFSESLFLFLVPISIIVAFISIYFLMDKSKKNFAFKKNAFMNDIRQLKKHNESLAEELKFLTTKLVEGETRWSHWDEEKQLLIQEKESLEQQIKNMGKSESAEREEIIIEYYVNERSSG